MCVIMKPRRNEEAQAHIGLSSHTEQQQQNSSLMAIVRYNKPQNYFAKGINETVIFNDRIRAYSLECK
jgi:hypothetical protein